MNHHDWLAQADIYALGALDGDELSDFEAHLAAGCPECDQHIAATREALTLLPQGLSAVEPPPRVKTRLLTQLTAETARAEPRRLSGRKRWWMLGVSVLAAAGLLLTLSLELYQTWQTLQQRDAALNAERLAHQQTAERIVTLQSELTTRQQRLEAQEYELQRIRTVVVTLEGDVRERDATLRLLAAPQVRLVHLVGLPPSPNASAQVLWNPATRVGVLFTAGLPQAPQERTYELWAIAGNEPVPAGTFEVDAAGHAWFRLPSLPTTKRFDKFAVTLEPAGGGPKPTGPMHLLGRV